MNEQDIIEGLQHGTIAALDVIFDKLYTRLCYWAIRIVNDKEDARDLVMESFVKLALSNEKFDNLQHVQGYLYKITERSCISHIRAGKVRAKYKEQAIKLGHPLTENAIEKKYHQSERIFELYEQINNLPERMQQAFRLAYIEGYRQGEIAQIMNISENTVRNMLERAKEIIRDAFNEKNAMIACFLLSYNITSW